MVKEKDCIFNSCFKGYKIICLFSTLKVKTYQTFHSGHVYFLCASFLSVPWKRGWLLESEANEDEVTGVERQDLSC